MASFADCSTDDQKWETNKMTDEERKMLYEIAGEANCHKRLITFAWIVSLASLVFNLAVLALVVINKWR